MRALVLGATGAVGRAVVALLRDRGHDVTGSSRSEGLRLDLSAPGGWSRLAEAAASHDVVVHAAGREDARLAAAVGATPLVELSATGAYLDALAAAAPPGARILLGAGLAPGLTTLLVDALDVAPGGEVDVAVQLGGGEAHGAAAVAWTASLAGADVHAAPEGVGVRNLVGWTRLPGPDGPRRYLRADFPDHVLAGRDRGIAVRSHLAIDDRLSTLALAAVGRIPSLAGLVARAPHLGDDGWFVAARDRATGEVVDASGRGQSRATAVVAVLAAERMAERADPGCVAMPAIATLEEAREALARDDAGARAASR